MSVTRGTKRLLWMGLVLLCLALYVALVRIFDLGTPWKFLGELQLRASASAIAVFLVLGDLMRFVQVKPEEEWEESEEPVDAKIPEACGESVPLIVPAVRPDSSEKSASVKEEEVVRSPTPTPIPTHHSNSSADVSAEGEALYAQARELKHQTIPDFKKDDEYLNLLRLSAAKGYPRASVKLGKYAMRRRAWVEAYYWMSQAHRNGMRGLLPMLREIRICWARDGFPGQTSNVNKIFSREAGDIGRALLRLDSGREAASAKEYLRTNHPELLRG